MTHRITFAAVPGGFTFRLAGFAGPDVFSRFRDLCREHGAVYRPGTKDNGITEEGAADLFLAFERAGFEARPFRASRGPAPRGEEFAAGAILSLAGMDPDHAREKNDVGFSSFDGEAGHSLAARLDAGHGLSDAQWSLVLKL